MSRPEDKFNSDIAFVVRKIKQQSFYTKKDNPVSYQIDLAIVGRGPLPEHENILLEKLEEWGAITVLERIPVPSEIMVDGYNISLNINQPKFDEIYNKYNTLGPTEDKKPAQRPAATKPTKKFPHKLAAGTRWEDFIIKFLDNNKVLVQVKGQSEELDYKAMGFDDKRSGKPDSQWAFFKILSAHGGEISWSDQNANDNFKKVKERLTTKLKSYFGIDYDPFYPYSEGKSYKIKPTLMPSGDVEGPKRPKLGMSEEIQGMFEDFEIDDK